jgi:large subunit ribosomal protein L7/L12
MSEEKKIVEVPAKFKSIVEEIEKMSVLDLSELVSLLEDKFNVTASAPMAMAMAAPAAAAEAAEEKSSFNVELTSTGDNKIGVIKAIREVTQLGLKEAKDLADGAPVMVKEGASKEEAENIKAKLAEAGATVTLK